MAVDAGAMEKDDKLWVLVLVALYVYIKWWPVVLEVWEIVPFVSNLAQICMHMHLVYEGAWSQIHVSVVLFVVQWWVSVKKHSDYEIMDLWVVFAAVTGHWIWICFLSKANRSWYKAVGYLGLTFLNTSVTDDLYYFVTSRGRWD